MQTIDWRRQMRVAQGGQIPFAMINGTEDPFINHAYCASVEYRNAFSDGPALIEGAGHAPFLEDSDSFAEKFLMFVQEC